MVLGTYKHRADLRRINSSPAAKSAILWRMLEWFQALDIARAEIDRIRAQGPYKIHLAGTVLGEPWSKTLERSDIPATDMIDPVTLLGLLAVRMRSLTVTDRQGATVLSIDFAKPPEP